tara:strand:- start:406 stop:534 length:129 start_codon:yes stop_codon:yes gene_type:complete
MINLLKLKLGSDIMKIGTRINLLIALWILDKLVMLAMLWYMK